MIPRNRRATAMIMLCCAYALPAQAQAQVMEIGADGEAAWVTGGLAGSAVVPSYGASAPSTGLPAANINAATPSAGNVLAHIPPAYVDHVTMLAARYNLSPALIEALVWQESRWRSNAVSPAGARGLAQLMPGTARDLGVDPNDPFANLEGGARYLRQQLDRFNGNLELALAAYNAGPERVIRSGGVPRIRETQNYVAAIMGRLAYHSRETR